jgi:T4 RnlA family RNA ligase
MNTYLLTYEDAKAISKRYNEKHFWEIQFMIGGYKLSSFNYFICGWDDFAFPLPEKPLTNAFDMRGTTFVFNSDESLYKRFLMLPKFFNLNQVEATQYGNVKDKKIVNVSVKEDGSLVAFMMLPTGKLFCKTIGSFASEQADLAYTILYTNEEHVIWVKDLLNLDFTPLFEYVSWDNRIVLKYGDAHLRYIGVRNNLSGEFFPAGTFDPIKVPAGISIANREMDTLDNLISRSKIEENKEGWVVQFEDGQLIKIKTEWYFRLHGLRTMNVFREDYVIANYLGETLDDILCQLNPDEDVDAFAFVKTVTGSIDNYIVHIDKFTEALKDKFINKYNSNWPAFASDCHKEAYFGLARHLIETPAAYNRKRSDFIIKMTFRLKNAKEIVEKFKDG